MVRNYYYSNDLYILLSSSFSSPLICVTLITRNITHILSSHYKIFDKLNTERSCEEEDEDWITEEIVDVEHNKVYTREVAI